MDKSHGNEPLLKRVWAHPESNREETLENTQNPGGLRSLKEVVEECIKTAVSVTPQPREVVENGWMNQTTSAEQKSVAVIALHLPALLSYT